MRKWPLVGAKGERMAKNLADDDLAEGLGLHVDFNDETQV
jgi:hypothetical protein